MIEGRALIWNRFSRGCLNIAECSPIETSQQNKLEVFNTIIWRPCLLQGDSYIFLEKQILNTSWYGINIPEVFLHRGFHTFGMWLGLGISSHHTVWQFTSTTPGEKTPGTSVVFPRAWLRCQHLKALPRLAQYDDATLGDFPDASSQTNLPQIPTASTKKCFFSCKTLKTSSFFEFCYGRY